MDKDSYKGRYARCLEEARCTHISTVEVTEGEKATVGWHVKNWAANFPVLKDLASCVVVVGQEGGEVKLKFFLQDYYEAKSGRRNHWLALFVTVFNGHEVEDNQLAFKVDVKMFWKENFYSSGSQHMSSTSHVVMSSRKEFTSKMVKEDFLHLETRLVDIPGLMNEAEMKKFQMPEDLCCAITVTQLQLNCKDPRSENSPDVIRTENSLNIDLKKMYESDDSYPDIKVESRDGIVLSGHQFILAARSPVMRKLIEEETKKNSFSGTIKLNNVDAKPLLVILRWMYTGELHSESFRIMEAVVTAATTYELKDLLKNLDRILITICTTQNMLELFQVAQQHGMTVAMTQISEFIKENIQNMVPPS